MRVLQTTIYELKGIAETQPDLLTVQLVLLVFSDPKPRKTRKTGKPVKASIKIDEEATPEQEQEDQANDFYVAGIRFQTTPRGPFEPEGIICIGDRQRGKPRLWRRPDFVLSSVRKIFGSRVYGMVIYTTDGVNRGPVEMFIKEFRLEKKLFGASDSARLSLLSMIQGPRNSRDSTVRQNAE